MTPGGGGLDRIEHAICDGWERIESTSTWRHVVDKGIDDALLAEAFSQLTHVVSHSPRSQALAVGHPTTPPDIRRYGLAHALDELQGEALASADASAAGAEAFEASPSVDALVGYLYYVAMFQGAVARLGWTVWAVDIWPRVNALLAAAGSGSQFVAEFDRTDASREVWELLERHAVDEATVEAVLRVTRTTMALFAGALDELEVGP